MTLLIFGGIGLVVFLLVVFSMLSRFFIKAEAGQALVKTGFGMPGPSASLSSAFVIPLLHRVDTLDLTVKTVRIQRRGQESLSCADGIRAEVEVDFYIKINAVQEDIQHVASTIGCGRASNIEILRELFEAKFADALKTAGAQLKFDQLYHNRKAFRDEILSALGQEGNQDIVLNGYKLDDVAIQYLEQLPLEMHNEDNVLDSRGRKEIAERTSSEVEQANHRLRQKEVTIAEQNREARVRQLAIEQDIKEREAAQKREIAEAEATEDAQTQKTVAEQEQVAEEARIAKEQRISVAEEERQQEIESAQIRRARQVSLEEEQKQEEIEIARIDREAAEAEALKTKLVKLEETAEQEAKYAKADERKETVRAVERANRQKQIEVIEAEQQAAVDREARQVEADVQAYEIRKVAEANLDGAKLDAEAAEEKAMAIQTVGLAEAEVREAELEAENRINERVILANALNEIIPQLPELVEKLMLPAEKIDSIRVLNVNGLERGSALPQDAMGGSNGGASGGSNVAGDVLGTVMNVGLLMPVIREVMQGLQGNDDVDRLTDALRDIPGGEALLRSVGDGASRAEPSPSEPSSASSASGASDEPTVGGPGAHSSEPPTPKGPSPDGTNASPASD